ncbi:Conserved hypothetical protein [gamma proteobacterium HdN1]|nr:Conserved hypothetical protein [gamma proteobacterium HdN1]
MTFSKEILSEWLVEQCPDGIIYSDANGKVALWNKAAEKIFGFTEVQAMGQSLDIIIPEELRSAHWKGFDAAMQAGTTKHKGKALPTKGLRADGSVIYVELSFAVILDNQGKAIGSLAQARDIDETYRKARADRKRLRELEDKLKT